MVLRIKNDLPCSLCSAPNCCHEFHKVFRSWGLQQDIKKMVALTTSEPKKLTILGTLPITICRVISPAPLWAHWQELGGQPFPTNWIIDHQEWKTRCNWEFCILRFTVTIGPAWQARPRPGTQLTQKCVGGTSMTKNVHLTSHGNFFELGTPSRIK